MLIREPGEAGADISRLMESWENQEKMGQESDFFHTPGYQEESDFLHTPGCQESGWLPGQEELDCQLCRYIDYGGQ
jgi:hypothetical protein